MLEPDVAIATANWTLTFPRVVTRATVVSVMTSARVVAPMAVRRPAVTRLTASVRLVAPRRTRTPAVARLTARNDDRDDDRAADDRLASRRDVDDERETCGAVAGDCRAGDLPVRPDVDE